MSTVIDIPGKGNSATAEANGPAAPVIPFGGVTKLDLQPDIVLEATKGKLKSFVIIGYDLDDDEYFAGTIADGGTLLWLIERCKMALLADRA